MFQNLKTLFQKIKYNFSSECCRDEMIERGYADTEHCGGFMGGDKSSGYLSYSCLGCPYLDLSYRRCKR